MIVVSIVVRPKTSISISGSGTPPTKNKEGAPFCTSLAIFMRDIGRMERGGVGEG